MCSSWLLFFRCRSFSPWWPLALILTAIIKCSCFSSNEMCVLFLSLALALSLLSETMWILQLSRKKESALLLSFFISRSLAIYRRNGRVLEMQNFTPAYMKGYYVLIFLEPKFIGCIDNQIFLPIVLRCEARARAPL